MGQKRAEQEAGKGVWGNGTCNHYPAYGASLLRIRQHPRDQIQWLVAAVTAALATGDRLAYDVHLGHLGVAYFLLGDYRRAIEFHEQNLAVSREIKDPQGEAAALGNLGLAYSSLGEFQRAIEAYQEQLRLTKKNQKPEWRGKRAE